jgi:hypothetical protein
VLFPGLSTLAAHDEWGRALVELGDLDGDGGAEVVVGLPGRDAHDGISPPDQGSLRVLRFDASGALRGVVEIGGAELTLAGEQTFGKSLARLGDYDGDGRPELAVGGPGLLARGVQPDLSGEVRILALQADGRLKSAVRIAEGEGGFTGALDDQDFFGSSVASLGDLDGDGIDDLAVGAQGDDDGGTNTGAVWILFLRADRTVRSFAKVSAATVGLAGALGAQDNFGSALAGLGDLDGDGIDELAVGARLDDDGGNNLGALWILFLRPDGTLRTQTKISATSGGLAGPLSAEGRFGSSCAWLGDLDGDLRPEIAVGAPRETTRGATGMVWIVSLLPDGSVFADHAFAGSTPDSSFGSALGRAADRNGDGIAELLVGASTYTEPEPEYTSLGAALLAAQTGDTVLVKQGAYGESSIVSRPVVIQAEAGAAVVTGSILVQGVSGGPVVMSGLTLEGTLELRNNTGLVWVEKTLVTPPYVTNNQAVSIDDCDDVVLVDVEVRASQDFFLWADGLAQDALRIAGNSTVNAYDCHFQGGPGSFYDCIYLFDCAQVGGAGVRLGSGSSLFLSGCVVRGGDGVATGDGWTGGDCSSGGDGLVSGGLSVVLATEFSGGESGQRFGVPCNVSGAASSGSVTRLPGQSLALEVVSPLRTGVAAGLTFEGPPFVPVFLNTSAKPLAVFLPIASGVLLTGSPRTFEYMGLTDASGRLEVDYPLAPLHAGEVVRELYLQASYFTMEPSRLPPPQGKVRFVPRTFILGRGTVLVELAAGF